MSGVLARARRLLGRQGAWIEEKGGAYLLRLGETRRARIDLTLDEATFRDLIAVPGLAVRPGGGWVAATGRTVSRGGVEGAGPGRPGVIEGLREVIDADGVIRPHRANLGESPIAWLARRRDQSGRPWLSPAEVAAGERLRMEAERAGAGASVTMRWDGLPRASGGSGPRMEPGDRAMTAAARVEAALKFVGPRLRPFVEHICIHDSSLKLAEEALGLRRRQGKTVLKQGLQALAEHYGIG